MFSGFWRMLGYSTPAVATTSSLSKQENLPSEKTNTVPAEASSTAAITTATIPITKNTNRIDLLEGSLYKRQTELKELVESLEKIKQRFEDDEKFIQVPASTVHEAPLHVKAWHWPTDVNVEIEKALDEAALDITTILTDIAAREKQAENEPELLALCDDGIKLATKLDSFLSTVIIKITEAKHHLTDSLKMKENLFLLLEKLATKIEPKLAALFDLLPSEAHSDEDENLPDLEMQQHIQPEINEVISLSDEMIAEVLAVFKYLQQSLSAKIEINRRREEMQNDRSAAIRKRSITPNTPPSTPSSPSLESHRVGSSSPKIFESDFDFDSELPILSSSMESKSQSSSRPMISTMSVPTILPMLRFTLRNTSSLPEMALQQTLPPLSRPVMQTIQPMFGRSHFPLFQPPYVFRGLNVGQIQRKLDFSSGNPPQHF